MTHVRGRTLLGFDFGRQRIGVAVAQELIGQASPLETLRSVGNKPDWTSIQRLIDRWKPDALVVGIPLEMDGSEQEMTLAARRFVRQLEGRMGLPVFGADERLSSIAATGMAFESGRSARRGRVVVDDLAAKVILDAFMAESHDHEQGCA